MTKADRYLQALLQAEAKCAHAGRNTSAQDIREARLSAEAAIEADEHTSAEEEVGAEAPVAAILEKHHG